ncbi:MAG: phage holin family protein [Acidobacteriota bacterium]
MKLLLRWAGIALAIFAAVKLLPGIYFNGPWWQLAIVALIFGLLNALVRPILKFLTCPLIILTLGLFVLVINAMMLWLTAKAAEAFGIDFRVHGFWSAFWGALIISIISAALNLLVRDEDYERPTPSKSA